jgi:hypothetical protein
MNETLAASHKPRIGWARVLTVAGVIVIVASAVLGYLSLQRMPTLEPVDFGQEVQMTATGSTSATIFASTGLSEPPSCRVTAEKGESVTVGGAEHYRQGGGLESTFGFGVTAGTRYTVTCSAAETGQFAVVQDASDLSGLFIAAGSLGLVLAGVGVALTARHGRRTWSDR